MRLPVAALVMTLASTALQAAGAEQKQAGDARYRTRNPPAGVAQKPDPREPRAGAPVARVIWVRWNQAPPDRRASLTQLLTAAVEGKLLKPTFTRDSRLQIDLRCLDILLNDGRP